LSASTLSLSRKYSYGDDESPKLFRSKQETERMKELTNKFDKFGEELLQGEISKKAREYLDRLVQLNSICKTEYERVISLR